MRFSSPVLKCVLLFAVLHGVCCSTVVAQSVPPATPASRPSGWAARLVRTNLSNFFLVTTNLYRGAQPSAKGMAELKSIGVKMVVNLRSFHSDVAKARGVGLKLGRLRMEPWHVNDRDVVAFLKLVTDTNNLPAFVHCQRGADRTGLLCAMYRVAVCGWTREEAIREMKDGGFRFDPAWKNLVRYIERADVDQLKRRAGILPAEYLARQTARR